jgi:hypothetical protein
LEEGIPITTPAFFASEERLPDKEIERIFRSDTKEQVPLLQERIRVIREAGRVLVEVPLLCLLVRKVMVFGRVGANGTQYSQSLLSSNSLLEI